MLFAISLLLARGVGPDLDQAVTLEVKAVDGVQLTNQLSAKTGVRFEAEDEAARDRYVLHVDHVPLSQVMGKIADAEHAEWLPDGNGFRLHRSPEKVAQLDAAYRLEVIKRFKKTQEEYRKKLAASPDFSDDAAKNLARQFQRLGPPPNGGIDFGNYWQRQNRLQESEPVGRAFMRLMLTFSPEVLADIPVHYRTVFATNPTPMQYQLPVEAFPAIQQMVSEQEIWEDAVNKYVPDNQFGIYTGMSSNGRMGTITSALVAFSRWDPSSGVSAELLLSDGKRRIVLQNNLYLDAPGDNFEPEPATPGSKPVKKEAPLPMPALDQEFAAKFRFSNFDRGERKALSDELRRFLSDPEKFDPLSGVVSDALIAIGKAHNEAVVAVLDDRSLFMFCSGVSDKGLDPAILKNVPMWRFQALSEKDGWLEMSETMPHLSDDANADRKAVHAMIQGVEAKGRLTLDDAADFALSSEHISENPIPRQYLDALFAPGVANTLNNDENVLRFYGTLTAEQRQGVEHLSFSALSQQQMAILQKQVYGDRTNLQQLEQEAPVPDENGQYFGFWNMIDKEATVSLGNGIPRDGFVKITPNNGRAIVAQMQYGQWYQGEQTYDVNSLAWMLMQSSTPDNNPWTVLGMYPADRTQVIFEFKFTQKLGETFVLEDTKVGASKPTDMNGLPDDLRVALLKAIADAKKQAAQYGNEVYYGYPGFGNRNGVPR